MVDFDAAFGRLVKDRRDKAGWSQEELATRVGLSRVSIVNIEAGRQRISLAHAISVASQLGIALEELQHLFGDAKLNDELENQPIDIRNELIDALTKDRK